MRKILAKLSLPRTLAILDSHPAAIVTFYVLALAICWLYAA